MARTKKDVQQDETGSAVEARILFACELGAVGDVVSVQAEQAQSLADAGFIDTHPDAVAYAKSLKA